MSKKALRLLVVALLVVGLVVPATAGAQTSGISFVCPFMGPGANAAFLAGDAVAAAAGAAAGYAPAITNLLLPQMSNGGVDGKGRTVLNASAFGFPVNVWVDAAWTAGANATLTNNAAGDYYCGGSGEDKVRGGAGPDSISGFTGNDKLYGQGGNDIIYGHDGDDHISGGADSDLAFGGAGNDTMRGKAGDDVLAGGPGNDNLKGDANNDILLGGGGHRLDAQNAAQVAVGPYGADGVVLTGILAPVPAFSGGADRDQYADGNDILDGGGNNDALVGGDGTDILKAGAGNDVLVGDYDDGAGASAGLVATIAATALVAGPYGPGAASPLAAYIAGDDVFDTTAPAANGGIDQTGDGVGDTFGGADDGRCGSQRTNADGDWASLGGGTDTSSNDCEGTTAEIQLA